jgi:RHS repeat-associated protein
VGRELSRSEIKDGAASGPKIDFSYDALGRLQNVASTDGTFWDLWNARYDPLGNIISKGNFPPDPGTVRLGYGASDRDRLCRIEFGPGGNPGPPCNVLYDARGNIISEPAWRHGTREFTYFSSGAIRTISSSQGAQAHFAYDAFGQVQELDVQGSAVENRRDRRYGGLIEQREIVVGSATASHIVRHIPGLGGILATRRGPTSNWIFEFGELRGSRFFINQTGEFIQGVGYDPFGYPTSTGAAVGTRDYSSYQWNGGDTIGAFGLSHLGARLYDPVIGRFLSRDPLVVPRTAAATNPYAFAMNDPLNAADPSGLDVSYDLSITKSYDADAGPTLGGVTPLGASPFIPPISPSNPFLSPSVAATQQLAPQTQAGRQLLIEASAAGIWVPRGFDLDAYARGGASLLGLANSLAQLREMQRDATVDAYNAELDAKAAYYSAIAWTVAEGALFAIGVSEGIGIVLASRGMLAEAAFFGYSIPGALGGGAAAGAARSVGEELKETAHEATWIFQLRPGGTGQALAGHGRETGFVPNFIVPSGTTFIAPPAGVGVPERIGQAIEAGKWGIADPWVSAAGGWRVFGPGSEAPNLVLYPGVGPTLTMYTNSIRVTEPGIPVDQLITENMGCVYWAACTVPFTARAGSR